jgi:hypothetical protein
MWNIVDLIGLNGSLIMNKTSIYFDEITKYIFLKCDGFNVISEYDNVDAESIYLKYLYYR